LPSFSDPEWSEERVETDAPVSRTRQSAIPMMSWFGRGAGLMKQLRRSFQRNGLRQALNSLARQPKRHLIALAIGSGVLLGVSLTAVIWSAEVAPGAPPPKTVPHTLPPPAPTAAPLPTTALSALPAVSDHPPQVTPVHSAPSAPSASEEEPRKRSSPA